MYITSGEKSQFFGFGSRNARIKNKATMQRRRLLVESLEKRNLLAAFSAGNLAIVRVDNGVSALTNASTAAFIDEYTTAGVLVQSIALPVMAAGANNPLTISGTSTSDGSLNLSSDGNFLVAAGYGTVPGTGAVTGTTSASVPRVIGRIAADGTVDTTTALNTFSATNFRGATSVDGNNFYAVGGNSGIQFAALGATGTSFTNISSTVTNTRTISIFDGNLYASSGSGSFRLTQVGTGLPTTAGQTTANIPGSPTTGSPYGFFYADLDATVSGVDTLYVADDTTNSTTAGGIRKFSLVGGVWTSNGGIAPGLTATPSAVSGARGLTGSISGTTITLFGTSNGTAGNVSDTLFSVVDTTGYNGTLVATPTVVSTLPSGNAVFRGIAFAPSGGADTTPPTVTSIDDGDLDNSVLVGVPLTYTVSFNEDIDAATVAVADFDNAGTATISIGAITETSNGVFTVVVTPNTTGSLVLRIPTGAVIQDVAGNSLVVPVQDTDTVTVTAADTTPPTVISIEDGDLDNIVLTNAVLNYTITFSEDIDGSTVTSADFVNSGTSLITIGTIVETTPGVFTVPVTPTSAGTLILQIPIGAVIKDLAGNDLVVPVSDNDTITVNIPDVTPPTLSSIVDNASGGPVLQGQQITYTLTFSEDISAASVTAADFDNAGTSTISVGTITEPTPGVFTVNVLALSAGTLRLRIPTGAVISDTSANNLVVPVEDDTTIAVNVSALSVGSIAFTAYQADNTGGAGGDFFEFVALTPIAAGQAIYFTDSAYQTTPGAFRTNENLLRWVAQSNVTAGTKISFTSTGGSGVPNTAEWTGINPSTGAFLTSATAAAIGLASGGDQVAAFVDPTFGGTDLLNGTAIAALHFGAADYPATLSANIDNSLTALPPGLVDGVTAVSVGDFANGRYDPSVSGSTETGTASVVGASINTDTNWENGAAGTVFGTGGTTATFVINAGTVTPTITATPLTKVYDGLAFSIIATADDGIGGFAADTNQANFSFTFFAGPGLTGGVIAAPTNVGSYSVNVAYLGSTNFNPVSSTAFDFTITPKALTVTAVANNKVFDGTTAATITYSNLAGFVGAETVTVTNPGTGTFASSAVGTNIAVTADAPILANGTGGGLATNYSLATPVGLTANITAVVATIANRRVFYNGATGANLSSAGAAENAVASDKVALLPGGNSAYANYTNYSRGLNGVIVDINNLPATTTEAEILASLQFAQWDGIAGAGFVALPGAAVPTATILAGSGSGGSARVKITFPDNSLQNTWLRVTVVANTQTALAANDVFYFGNVIGEFNTGNTATRLRVNATDTGAVRSNQSTAANSAPVTNIFDVNRDGRVNATDTGIVRNNQQTAGIVAPITVPLGPSIPSSGASASAAPAPSIGTVIVNPLSALPGTVSTVSGSKSGQRISDAPTSPSTDSRSAVLKGSSEVAGTSVDKKLTKMESLDLFFASLQ